MRWRNARGEGTEDDAGRYATQGERKRASVVALAISSTDPGSAVSGPVATSAARARENAKTITVIAMQASSRPGIRTLAPPQSRPAPSVPDPLDAYDNCHDPCITGRSRYLIGCRDTRPRTG